MFPGPLFIFFALPSMISISWFLIQIHPQLPSCDPATMLRHLVWFPPLSPLPFRRFHPTPTPPTPLSVHPRVYPLITDLPSSLQSSSVPHRSSGESEWQRNITLCVIPKVNERGKACVKSVNLWQRAEGDRWRKSDYTPANTPWEESPASGELMVCSWWLCVQLSHAAQMMEKIRRDESESKKFTFYHQHFQ